MIDFKKDIKLLPWSLRMLILLFCMGVLLMALPLLLTQSAKAQEAMPPHKTWEAGWLPQDGAYPAVRVNVFETPSACLYVVRGWGGNGKTAIAAVQKTALAAGKGC